MALDLSRLTPEEQATAIYIGYYNRAADPIGFDFWLDAVNDPAVSLAQIGDLFAPQVETLAAYPFLGNPTAAEAQAFIGEVYLNLFNRAPDQAGLDFYSQALLDSINGTSSYSIGQIILDIIGGAQDTAAGNDRATILNKIEAALAWTDAADAANIDYQFGSAAEQSAKDVVDAVDDTQASVDQAKADANAFFGVSTVLTAGNDTVTGNVIEAPRDFTPGGNDQVNTLDDDDVLTGQGTNPTLNFTYVDDADIGATVITPTMNGIETINVSVQGNAPKSLDLQDSSGVDAINVSRVNASNLFQALNIAAPASDFSVNNSINNLAAVNFAHVSGALAGSADETNLTLNGAQLAALNVDNTVFGFFGNVVTAPTEGYETINVTSTGNANAVDVLGIFGTETLNISGGSDLLLGATNNTVNAANNNVEAQSYGFGLNGVAGFINTVDASAMTGDFTYHIGAEINAASSKNSGAPIQMAITGGAGDDSFVLTAGANVGGATNNTDVIDGGAGADKLVMNGTATVAAAATANIRNVEALEIRTGHDGGAAADTIAIDADAFDSLATVFVRNEGQNASQSAAEAATVTLTDLTAAQATAITVAHGTTGNNRLDATNAGAVTAGETRINVDLKAPGASDTVGITIVNGQNTDVRSNFELNAFSNVTPGNNQTSNVENITITDSDTESNAVLLTQATTNTFVVASAANLAAGTGPVGHTGTVTLTGGTAGTFFNLDATANAYRYDQTGNAVDGGTGITGTAGNRSDVDGGVAERLNAATVDASGMASNVIVRVSDNSADNLGGQTITMGTGNDTVIFDQIVNTAANFTKAGLTINDTVNGGDGNDILGIDGHNTAITLGASEWTNVSNFEVIRLIGNDVAANNALGATNSYNLTLTNELLAANGAANGAGRQITIVNDNDGNNDVVTNSTAGDNDWVGVNSNAAGAFGLTGNEGGVTIDVRALNAQNSIRYNGEEVRTNGAANQEAATAAASATADRFIFSDQNINASSVIDGGRVYGAVTAGVSGTTAQTQATSNFANADVLEVRNSAVVSLGDLANISNVGTLQFTNDQAVAQTSQLTLDSAAIDRLVNDGQAASTTNGDELIQISALDNANVANAVTQLNVDSTLAGALFDTNILLGRGVNTVATGAGEDTIHLLGGYNAAYATANLNALSGNGIVGGAVNGTTLSSLANNGGVRVVTDTINLGAGNDTVNTYGAINIAGATINGGAGALNVNSFSAIVISEQQLADIIASGGDLSFDSTGNHQLFIKDSASYSGPALDLSKVVVNSGTLAFNFDGGVAVTGAVSGNGGNRDASITEANIGLDGGNNPVTPPAPGFTTVDLSGQSAVTAQAGVAEAFVLEFNSGSGSALSSDAVVSISGFDPNEDKIVFDDANATPQDAAVLLNGAGGAVVAADPFANSTTISFQDDNGSDQVDAAQLTLLGIQDATLGGATPFFEVV